MNNYQGGFNCSVIRACADISTRPIIVWFPTISAQNFLDCQEYEIDKKWIPLEIRDRLDIKKAKDVRGLSVLNQEGGIKQEVSDVLREIKNVNAILATGHISWQEAYVVVKEAKKIGIKKIIITHPIYQKINMPKILNSNLFLESFHPHIHP